MAEKQIGKVIHYFDKAMVAVVRLYEKLEIGDAIVFKHGDNEFTETVESMEINHEKIKKGKEGDEVAIKMSQRTHENAKVYKTE